ncbi:hypothetical protein WN943_011337 [Citrus x changshan-huyou]
MAQFPETENTKPQPQNIKRRWHYEPKPSKQSSKYLNLTHISGIPQQSLLLQDQCMLVADVDSSGVTNKNINIQFQDADGLLEDKRQIGFRMK